MKKNKHFKKAEKSARRSTVKMNGEPLCKLFPKDTIYYDMDMVLCLNTHGEPLYPLPPTT